MKNKQNNKKVAFDIGNVLCYVDFDEFLDFLVVQKVASSKYKAFDLMSCIQAQNDVGFNSIKQCFYLMNNSLDKNTIENLYNKWMDIIKPSDLMIELINDLIHKYKYEVALLSNIGTDHSEFLKQKCPIFNKCYQYFSCDIGARKPNKLFYQSFIFQYKWNNDVLFFDDRLENIQASKDYFKGILFNITDYKTDEEAVKIICNYLDL